MAARAYDVAALTLKGKGALLNFPDAISSASLPSDISPKSIQAAAAAHASASPPCSLSYNPRPRPRPIKSLSRPRVSGPASSAAATPAAANSFSECVNTSLLYESGKGFSFNSISTTGCSSNTNSDADEQSSPPYLSASSCKSLKDSHNQGATASILNLHNSIFRGEEDGVAKVPDEYCNSGIAHEDLIVDDQQLPNGALMASIAQAMLLTPPWVAEHELCYGNMSLQLQSKAAGVGNGSAGYFGSTNIEMPEQWDGELWHYG